MSTIAASLIGLGIYGVPDAARLLKVPTAHLRRWADGYTFRPDGRRRSSSPIIRVELGYGGAGRDIRVITFLDLVELMFVTALREHEVSMKVIRAAAAIGAELFETDHPFAARRFETEGRRIFAALERDDARPRGVSRDTLAEELARSRYVFGHTARAFFKKLEYREEEAVRYWPLGKHKRVVLDPQRSFGKPIDAETGVPAWVLYQSSLGGNDARDIARWYEVPLDAVRCAIEFEALLAA